jgi:hypothetical protein
MMPTRCPVCQPPLLLRRTQPSLQLGTHCLFVFSLPTAWLSAHTDCCQPDDRQLLVCVQRPWPHAKECSGARARILMGPDACWRLSPVNPTV